MPSILVDLVGDYDVYVYADNEQEESIHRATPPTE
jgi:hypothetical protein